MRLKAISMVLGSVLCAWVGPPAAAQENGDEIVRQAATLTTDDIPDLMERARDGDSTAQLMLGLAYAYGYGVDQDHTEAAAWHRMAAEQGVARAQDQLGKLYHLGKGVEADPVAAAGWFQLAAEQEFPEGQFDLGVLYFEGSGVERDLEQAFFWFKKAAEHGFAQAQANVGAMYIEGVGVEPDPGAGSAWLRMAAEAGNLQAQANLGAVYAYGLGGPPDSVEALRWLLVAVAGGAANVQPMVDQLEAQMSAAAVGEAKRRAAGEEAKDVAESSSAQAPGEVGRARSVAEREAELVAMADWFRENLAEYGSISLRATRDMARALSYWEADLDVHVRHEVSEVSLEACELRRTEHYSVTGSGSDFIGPGAGPLRSTVVLRLGSIDLASIRVQEYDYGRSWPSEMSRGWRLLDRRFEVNLKTRRGTTAAEAFVVIPQGGAERTSFEEWIPVSSLNRGKELAEAVRKAADLCGAR